MMDSFRALAELRANQRPAVGASARRPDGDGRVPRSLPGLRSGSGRGRQEAALPEIVDCLTDLGLAVHHKRAAADDRFVDRLASEDE
jgi:hypothetical protein